MGIKEITDTAGVPKGSFYGYHDSKNAFVAAVVDHHWNAVVRDHGPLLADLTVPPAGRLEAFFEALTRYHAERGFALGCLLGNLALELTEDNGRAQQRLSEVMDQRSALTSTCLPQAKDAGEVGATAGTAELASVIIECWDGAVLRGSVDRSRIPFDRFLTVSLPRLLDTAQVSVWYSSSFADEAAKVRRYLDGLVRVRAVKCRRTDSAEPKPHRCAMSSTPRRVFSRRTRARAIRCTATHCMTLVPVRARNLRRSVRVLIWLCRLTDSSVSGSSRCCRIHVITSAMSESPPVGTASMNWAWPPSRWGGLTRKRAITFTTA
ncbi:hypothetical protein SCHAM137S_02117 [Streptomyces chartreusis]